MSYTVVCSSVLQCVVHVSFGSVSVFLFFAGQYSQWHWQLTCKNDTSTILITMVSLELRGYVDMWICRCVVQIRKYTTPHYNATLSPLSFILEYIYTNYSTRQEPSPYSGIVVQQYSIVVQSSTKVCTYSIGRWHQQQKYTTTIYGVSIHTVWYNCKVFFTSNAPDLRARAVVAHG